MRHAPQPSAAGSLLTPVTCPALSAQRGIRHAFFTRQGGVSTGLYASLNCAYGTGDAAQDVLENLRRMKEALKANALARVYQVHGTQVVVATEAWPMEERPHADAIVTNVPHLAVGVSTADCLPILLADTQHKVVAAAHAGWKGALSGVVEATLAAMETLGAKISGITAAIGPAIAQGSYEVGAEFHARFLEQDSNNNQYFIHGQRQGYWLFDLKAYAKDRLRNAGISQINVLANDTCLEENDFFSYRRATLRGEASYGCQLSAIVLS